jgi:hypothetical protein
MSAVHGLLARFTIPVSETEPSLSERADWGEVQRLADWHRLSQLAARFVRDRPHLPIPVDVRDHWKTAYTSTAATNLYLRRELDRVAARLERADIPVIVLKGMALLDEVYGELGLRPMVDIDLLVPEPFFADAGALLQELGYHGHEDFVAAP